MTLFYRRGDRDQDEMLSPAPSTASIGQPSSSATPSSSQSTPDSFFSAYFSSSTPASPYSPYFGAMNHSSTSEDYSSNSLLMLPSPYPAGIKPLAIASPFFHSPLPARRNAVGGTGSVWQTPNPRLISRMYSECPAAFNVHSLDPLTPFNGQCRKNSVTGTSATSANFNGFRPKKTQSLQGNLLLPLDTSGFLTCENSPLPSKRFETTDSYTDDLIDLQSVEILDSLHETALARLTKLFQQYSDAPTGPRHWSKRIQFAKNFRSFVRQVKGIVQPGNIVDNNEECPVVSTSRSVWGMSLGSVHAMTVDASPLPRFIHDLMGHLAKSAHLGDGIFRKNGVKLRIQEIKEICSKLDANTPIPSEVLTDSQLHDLADALKQYFRELPEFLMTERISELLESSVSELPEEKHFVALHYCILLLPTENREALMILLRFLNGIAQHSDSNQMSASNLATCLMPSLFHLAHCYANGTAKGSRRRKTIGMPNEKERNTYNSVKEMLTQMIIHWETLLRMPSDLAREARARRSRFLEGVGNDLQMPIKNGQFDFTDDILRTFRRQHVALKECHFGGWKNWELCRVFPDGTHIYTRGVSDSVPLKVYRIQININAPMNQIHAAILHNRRVWDANVVDCCRWGPAGQNFDVIRVTHRMPNSPVEKTTFLARRWSYNEINGEPVCSVIERSVVPKNNSSFYQQQSRPSNKRVDVYKSSFLIVPLSPGHSQLIYLSRIDLRGKSSLWYERVYGEMLANRMSRLKHYLTSKCHHNPIGTLV